MSRVALRLRQVFVDACVALTVLKRKGKWLPSRKAGKIKNRCGRCTDECTYRCTRTHEAAPAGEAAGDGQNSGWIERNREDAKSGRV